MNAFSFRVQYMAEPHQTVEPLGKTTRLSEKGVTPLFLPDFGNFKERPRCETRSPRSRMGAETGPCRPRNNAPHHGPMDNPGNSAQKLYRGPPGTGTGQGWGKSLLPQLQGSGPGRSLKKEMFFYRVSLITPFSL